MRRILPLVGVMAIAFLPSPSQADDDPHDDLIYSRYSKRSMPTAYKLRSGEVPAPLERPATEEDVDAGRAIFTCRGLGEARIAELPEDDPRWKQHRNPFSRDRVTVCQAEELNVGGQWKRYYGVLSAEGAAVVPAEQWETWWPDAPWIPYQENPFSDDSAGLNPFGNRRASDPFARDDVPENGIVSTDVSIALGIQRPKSRMGVRRVDDPLLTGVHFANTEYRPLSIPAKWYSATGDGKPVMAKAVSLSLEWTPYDPGYPLLRESVEVATRENAGLERDTTSRTVKSGESCLLFRFDLRDWFQIESEGYYRLEISIDWDSLGLMYQNARCVREFTIGKPPKLPSVKEYNEARPVFGSPQNEERLKQLINRTINPDPVESKPLSPGLKEAVAWSKPVAGLSARIEYIRPVHWESGVCFVRLKNVSDGPLIVPSGNPSAEGAIPWFDLHVQHGAGPWRCVAGSHDFFIATPTEPETDALELRVTDRPWVTLSPGEDSLAVFHAWNEEDCVVANRAKIVLRQPDKSVPGRWSGLLETPPRAMALSAEQFLARRGALPLPKHFPRFSYDLSGYPSAPPEVADVSTLDYGNGALLEILSIYQPEGVREEFERRLRSEEVPAVKLLQASVAAPLGSEEAACYLLEMVKDTDYRTVLDTQAALALTCDRYSTGPPDWQRHELPEWLVELSLATLSDGRFVTGYEKVGNISIYGPPFTVASCDWDLMTALALPESRKAVPRLIEWARSGRGDAIWALGTIGGEQALSALAELAKDKHLRSQALAAFSEVRDKQAVPILVRILEDASQGDILAEHAQVIWALGRTGDERAIPVLLKLLEKVDKSDGSMEYGRPQSPLSAFIYALSHLKATGAVPSLLRFVEYPEIIECLGEIGDPAALPALRRIVAAKGRLFRNGNAVSPELEADRYFAARMALCTWDDDRGAARVLEMVGDAKTAMNHRRDLVEALGRSHQPAAIPALVAIIKSASGRDSIRAAISALGEMKHKAAAEGLIECFDAEFKEEHWGKGEQVTPATYHNDIALSLESITGRSFGNDKNQWRQWWQQEGRYSAKLK